MSISGTDWPETSQAERKRLVESAARRAAMELSILSADSRALDKNNQVFNPAELTVLGQAQEILDKVTKVVNPPTQTDSDGGSKTPMHN